MMATWCDSTEKINGVGCNVWMKTHRERHATRSHGDSRRLRLRFLDTSLCHRSGTLFFPNNTKRIVLTKSDNTILQHR